MNERAPWLKKAFKEFDRLPLSVRFVLAFTPLVIAVVWMSVSSGVERYQTTRDMARMERYTDLAIESGSLAGHLQLERGLSIIFVAQASPATRTELNHARAATDEVFNSLSKALDQSGKRAATPYLSDLRALSQSLLQIRALRNDIDRQLATAERITGYFSNLVQELNNLTGRLSGMPSNNQLGRKLHAYFIIKQLKELLGQERLLITRALLSGELTEENRAQLQTLLARQTSVQNQLSHQLSNTSRYTGLTAASPAIRFRDRLLEASGPSLDNTDVSPRQWFTWQTARMDRLTQVESLLADDIHTLTDDLMFSATEELWRYLLISPLTLLACMTFAILIFRQTHWRLLLSQAVFEHTHDRITVTDQKARIIEINDAFERNTGYSREEVLGQNPNMLQSGRQDKSFYRELWQQLNSEGTWQGEIWNRRKSGEFFAELTTISAIRNRQGSIENYVAVSSDITDRALEHQRQLEYRAYHDPLTGLPNQILLRDRLDHALTLARRTGTHIIVAALDLDHFSTINEQYTHASGDVLIERIANRLRGMIRDSDTLARTGGDEFLVVVEQLGSLNEGQMLMERLLDELSAPIEFNGHTTALTASIGATGFPDDNADADTLIRHATEALHQSKHNGRARLSWFDPAHGRNQSDFSDLLQRLERALANDELQLHYQPKVDMLTGRLLGVEALLRWQYPQQGMVSPGDFLPAVELHPISIAIGDRVIEMAIDQVQRWQSEGLATGVSVNINATQLLAPDFIASLKRHLRRHPGFDPSRLELEVLESAAINDIDRAATVLAECRKLGVKVSLDDFGTGYAALDYLKRLPADTLKIDQSFVRDMDSGRGNLAIVKGIIGLARAFGFEVIAEGVETIDQGCELIELGCFHGQGFGIARPMPAGELEGWLQGWQTPPAWRQRKVG